MASVQVVRTELRCTVGVWCADLHQGQVLAIGKSLGPGIVTQDIADYLTEHDVVVPCDDGATYDPWFQARAAGEEAPDASELEVPRSHYDTNYGAQPLIDGDVGGGFIHASQTTAPVEGT